jgi:TRAP transporter TAXI family solute receptor
MKRAFFLGAVLVMAAAVLAARPTAAVRAQEILIGTGSTSGVYYPAGRAICRLVERKAEGLTCKALPTPGSLSNLTNVTGGAIELGLVQSDWQFHAVKGTGQVEFMGADFSSLRALFSLHGEPFTVVARRDSGIEAFDDLKDKRVNIGNPGSGQRATMEVVMAAKGWTKKDFSLAEELPASQQSLALCHNRVQAMIYTVGHPNASVGQAVGLCDARVIEVAGGAIDKLVAENPYYAYTTIPGGMYEGHADDVRTFGVKATVVSSADVDAETIYAVVKAVFDNLDDFRRMHPAFGILSPEEMARDGLSAPLHEGAERYFREKGLR